MWIEEQQWRSSSLWVDAHLPEAVSGEYVVNVGLVVTLSSGRPQAESAVSLAESVQ